MSSEDSPMPEAVHVWQPYWAADPWETRGGSQLPRSVNLDTTHSHEVPLPEGHVRGKKLGDYQTEVQDWETWAFNMRQTLTESVHHLKKTLLKLDGVVTQYIPTNIQRVLLAKDEEAIGRNDPGALENAYTISMEAYLSASEAQTRDPELTRVFINEYVDYIAAVMVPLSRLGIHIEEKIIEKLIARQIKYPPEKMAELIARGYGLDDAKVVLKKEFYDSGRSIDMTIMNGLIREFRQMVGTSEDAKEIENAKQTLRERYADQMGGIDYVRYVDLDTSITGLIRHSVNWETEAIGQKTSFRNSMSHLQQEVGEAREALSELMETPFGDASGDHAAEELVDVIIAGLTPMHWLGAEAENYFIERLDLRRRTYTRDRYDILSLLRYSHVQAKRAMREGVVLAPHEEDDAFQLQLLTPAQNEALRKSPGTFTPLIEPIKPKRKKSQSR